MITPTDISNGYTTAQAAVLLGVDTHEVTRLYRTGAIVGQKIAGGILLLDSASVQEFYNAPRKAGRPWDAQTAWAALLLLEGVEVDAIPYHRMRRLKQKLATITAEELVWLARKRQSAQRYNVSPSFSEDLRSALCLTGMSASSASDLGLVVNSKIIDGYSKDAPMLAEELYLMPDAIGNCTVRSAIGAPSELLEMTEMPIAVVAADLALSLDSRERRCGLDYLKGALDAIR